MPELVFAERDPALRLGAVESRRVVLSRAWPAHEVDGKAVSAGPAEMGEGRRDEMLPDRNRVTQHDVENAARDGVIGRPRALGPRMEGSRGMMAAFPGRPDHLWREIDSQVIDVGVWKAALQEPEERAVPASEIVQGCRSVERTELEQLDEPQFLRRLAAPVDTGRRGAEALELAGIIAADLGMKSGEVGSRRIGDMPDRTHPHLRPDGFRAGPGAFRGVFVAALLPDRSAGGAFAAACPGFGRMGIEITM